MKQGFIAVAAALLAMAAGSARAQDFGGAFGGFTSNSEAPIQIEADKLEVFDTEKLAIYSGNVRARQGDTLLEAPELRVFYAGAPDETGQPGTELSRIEAGPNVVVSSLTQTASGERMVIDIPRDLITMSGNVVLTEGQNVVRGEQLVVNMVTKEGRMDGGRVQTLITPSGGRPAGQ